MIVERDHVRQHSTTMMTSLRLALRTPRLVCHSRSRLFSAVHSRLPSSCPACGAPLPTRLPACPKCLYIQPISDDHDAYDVLNTPPGTNPFRVDTTQLKRTFHDIQRYVHPDIWAPHGEVRLSQPITDI